MAKNTKTATKAIYATKAIDQQLAGLANILERQRSLERAAKAEKEATTAKLLTLVKAYGKTVKAPSGVKHTTYKCKDGTVVDIAHTEAEVFCASSAVEVLKEYDGTEDYIFETTSKEFFEQAILSADIEPEEYKRVISIRKSDRVYVKFPKGDN